MSNADSSRTICLGVAQSLEGRAWHTVNPDDQVTASLVRSLDLPDAVARILSARGFTPETAEPFLNPTLRDLMPDPSTLAGMDAAVSRVIKAIDDKEKSRSGAEHSTSPRLVEFLGSIAEGSPGHVMDLASGQGRILEYLAIRDFHDQEDRLRMIPCYQ